MKKFYFLVLLLNALFISREARGQNNDHITGTRIIGDPAVSETAASIMARAALADKNVTCRYSEPELQEPDRSNLPQNPFSKASANYPESTGAFNRPGNTNQTLAPQTPGLSFNGVTGPAETGSFPPDDMGAIGPAQFVVFVNGRLRTFNKSTGVADGVLNASPDIFFASVMSTPGSGQSVFTSDPRVRYDRLTGKWYFLIIDVVITNATGATPTGNRVLLAVSNTSTLTGATTFSFFFFLPDATKFSDYPTLGVDANALYIGTNMFTLAGSFSGTNGYVVKKTSILGAGPIVVTGFTGLASGSGTGPYTPQGVDNFDPSATEGYFIGSDNASFGTLVIRRVSTPGGTPTISGNISLTVSSTSNPLTVPHLGNTGGTNGNLDALDDRLFGACMYNGRLWTAHNIAVLATGVAATSGATRRNGSRWYEIQNLNATASVVQSGTVFDAAASNPRFYSVPTVMVSGQGHAAMSFTTGGLADRSNAATAGRLSGDVLGNMQATVLTTASSTAYNPSGDPGGSGGRRWGDYSYVSLDPLDNMTMWMIGQYCVSANSYGCNVTKLIAPPPATPTSASPGSINKGLSSVDVVITGIVAGGSGFYDPGANLASPALAFNHISASVTGGVTVNSITYTDPTHITLNLNTTGASLGLQTVTVTNPDGQSLTSATGIINIIGPLPVSLLNLQGRLNNNLSVTLQWQTASEFNNRGFYVERNETNDLANWQTPGFVAGAGNSNLLLKYGFLDKNIDLNKIYRYRLKQVDLDGYFTYSNEVVVRVKDLQKNSLLVSTYPNPFKAVSNITYNLPVTGYVSIKVFSALGTEVANLVDKVEQSGIHTVSFNAAELNVSKGVYYSVLEFNGEKVTNKMIMIE